MAEVIGTQCRNVIYLANNAAKNAVLSEKIGNRETDVHLVKITDYLDDGTVDRKIKLIKKSQLRLIKYKNTLFFKDIVLINLLLYQFLFKEVNSSFIFLAFSNLFILIYLINTSIKYISIPIYS